jgi:hypothetical protein
MIDTITELIKRYPLAFIIIVIIAFIGNLRAIYLGLRKFDK